MTDLRVFMKLLAVMMIVSTGAIVITTSLLYFDALEGRQDVLAQVAARYRRAIMSVVEYHQAHTVTEHIDQGQVGRAEIIKQIKKLVNRAHALIGLRGDISLITGVLEGNEVVFLNDRIKPNRIKMGSRLAVPMQMALRGGQGTVRSIDFAGQNVIASYSYLDSIGMGIVAKSRVTDINWRFVKGAMLAVGPAMALVLMGVWYFARLGNRLVHQLRKDNERYKRMVEEVDRINKTLVENEQRLQCFFEAAFEGIVITRKGVFIDCNQRFADMFGYTVEEVVGMRVKDLVYTEDYPMVQKHISECYQQPYEHRSVHKSGKVVQVEVHGQASRIKGETVRITAIHDLTERYKMIESVKELANRDRQISKMEAIGNFASGIAHDFNNTLTPIIGNCDLLMIRMDKEDPNRANVEKIINAASTAQLLVHRIQTFTRKDPDPTTMVPLKVDACIKEAFEFLRSITPKSIAMEMHTASNLGHVTPTDVMIRQILMNLVKNSAQAIGHKPGKIVIDVSNTDILVERWGLLPGPHVKIEVEDNGCGMSKEVLDQAMDPYYTTKDKEGTGLGLSVVHGILKSHQGIIYLQSEEELGTMATVYLPAKLDPDAEEEFCTLGEPIPQGSGQRILFVDDEEGIVHMAVAVLISLGYKAVGIVDSEEALGEFCENPQSYEVLMTDLTMPNMSGIELIQQTKKINPKLKVILSSGFGSNGKYRADPYRDLIDTFLQKPVTRRQYGNALADLLSAENK